MSCGCVLGGSVGCECVGGCGRGLVCRVEGEFEKGRYGHCIMTETIGSQYTGRFTGGKFGGEGVYQWPRYVANSMRYVGAFHDGRMHWAVVFLFSRLPREGRVGEARHVESGFRVEG
jgi:hypothetical protein